MADHEMNKYQPLLDYLRQISLSRPGPDKDLECYLTVIDLIQCANKTGGEGFPIKEDETLRSFVDRHAADLPCTSAALLSNFRLVLRSGWTEKMLKSFIDQGVHHDYQAIALAEMLLPESRRTTYGSNTQLKTNLMALSALAHGALDRVTFESEEKRDRVEDLLKHSFLTLEERGSILYCYGLLEELNHYYGEERTSDLVKRLFDPLSRLHEESCKVRINFGNDMSIFDRMAARLNSIREGGNRHGTRLEDYSVILSNVLSTLAVPGGAWPEICKKGKPEHRIFNLAVGTERLIEALKRGSPDPLSIRNALTAFAKPAMEAAFANKSSVNNSNEKLMSVFLDEIDVPKLLSSLKPGAKRMFTSYVAMHRPKLVAHLDNKGRGEVLEHQLGI